MAQASKSWKIFASGLILLIAAVSVRGFIRQFGGETQNEVVWKPLPGPGKKCPLDGDLFFTYEFSEKPKMGTVVLIVKVFDKSKTQVGPFAITGRSDMPSMKGAHDSGEVDFKLNKKNDYLMPVHVAMPGEWEVRLTFFKEGKPVFRGSLKFNA